MLMPLFTGRYKMRSRAIAGTRRQGHRVGRNGSQQAHPGGSERHPQKPFQSAVNGLTKEVSWIK